MTGLGIIFPRLSKRLPGRPADIVKLLKDTGTQVVVNYLPVGSEEATKWYVEQVLEAGCAFVNCIPVFIARENYWRQRFEKRGLPIIGDDIKSQVGATIVHRILARLFRERGVRLERTSQLNVGGNHRFFFNMLERSRLESKKDLEDISGVTSQLDYDMGPDQRSYRAIRLCGLVLDRKWAYIRLEGRTFGDVPLNVELNFEVWVSTIPRVWFIDAVRCCRLGARQ
jgi:myo-inositol-1-phosphate synthase